MSLVRILSYRVNIKLRDDPGVMQLNRSQSMTRAFEFARVRKSGVSSAGRFLVLSCLEVPEVPVSKFGIIVTRKVGNACMRNKLRRRVREVLRSCGEVFEAGYFVVVILRWRAVEADLEALKEDFLRSVRRIKRGEGRVGESPRLGGPRGKKPLL